MFSQRRMRLLVIAVLVILGVTWYYSSDARSVQNQQFYRSTVAAMNAQKQAKEAQAAAANIPAPNRNPIKEDLKHPMVDDKIAPAIPKANPADHLEEIPIAGRTKMTVSKKPEEDEKVELEEKQQSQQPQQQQQQEQPKQQESKPQQAGAEDDAEAEAHAHAVAELNDILKRAPIIIFSKSYCPYSAKAKSILLDHYSITPAPFVVELDQHPHGRMLQAVLAETTGRRTVPNVLVNGKSIGGGDDVTALDGRDELTSTLRDLGGKWVQEVHRKDSSD
ncbi:glutaredoxin [Aspergillus brunneoviolaceus CBS 621.78]|uniref:Glutaredoxin n=1 Tax=Aspergillus brunneoviolaceus CBS 621.78 TaxID=1450534 RepID=A0ACD1G8A0_9EURO|nr:glutaredoxin [Aspergillus brunneoviolaceus CBS 621.78]RAH45509.1 glutaredoxin [Aspergillus brunneoviolaceus CBS 621.78]